MRDAVVAARTAFEKWSAMTPMNRGLVLYRLAEMMDARRGEFVERLRLGTKIKGGAVGAKDGRGSVNIDETEALRETIAAIDRTLWYAGRCDKYAAVLSTGLELALIVLAMGIVGVVAPDEPSLLGLVSSIIPPLVSGNTVVAIASEADPRSAIVFAECLATCDLPPGVCNILTGRRIELAPHLARHMDVNALSTYGLDAPFAAELERLGADNLKRTRTGGIVSPAEWFGPEFADLEHVAAFVETKTIWHPAGI